MFNKAFLSYIRRKAFRRGVWFSSLDDVERGILSISLKVLDSVKSSLLNFQLVIIVEKLRDACRGESIKRLEWLGIERVKAIQAQALSFGYKGSEKLGGDIGFIRYVIFLDCYQPIGWRTFE
jgi:hypothetical protein